MRGCWRGCLRSSRVAAVAVVPVLAVGRVCLVRGAPGSFCFVLRFSARRGCLRIGVIWFGACCVARGTGCCGLPLGRCFLARRLGLAGGVGGPVVAGVRPVCPPVPVPRLRPVRPSCAACSRLGSPPGPAPLRPRRPRVCGSVPPAERILRAAFLPVWRLSPLACSRRLASGPLVDPLTRFLGPRRLGHMFRRTPWPASPLPPLPRAPLRPCTPALAACRRVLGPPLAALRLTAPSARAVLRCCTCLARAVSR